MFLKLFMYTHFLNTLKFVFTVYKDIKGKQENIHYIEL